MMRTFDTAHTTSCLSGSRVVVLGDSVARQLYYSLVKKVLPDASTDGDRHSDIFFSDPESGTTFEFYWDPVLNSTKATTLLTGSDARIFGSEEKPTPSIFLVGTGLWYLRYPEWSGGMEKWQQVMEKLVRQMGNPRLLPLAQQLFISPIPAVNSEKLSEERARTLLPEDINYMNSFLMEATAESPVSVPFTWNKMTETAASETHDGLHYVEKVMTVEADILLNFVCNNKLPKVSPMGATCCYEYPSMRWFQVLMLGIFLVWIPTGFVVHTYYRQHSAFFPSLAILRSFAVVGAAVACMYYADRTSFLSKGNKVFSASSFTFLVFLSIVAGLMTLKQSEVDQPFLSRDQTDEWKGWMQIVILIYHYVAASNVSAIYNPVRMLVASYLFMTGFGHFIFYYKKADFGFNRVASVLTRLNLLTLLLTYTMDMTYLAYYFAPLVSFFYLVIYGMMYIGHSYNHNSIFIVSKIIITAILTAGIIHTPLILDTIFGVLHFFFGISWSASEWRFRLQLDVWIVFVGALFAYGFIKAQDISITAHPRWNAIRQTSILASLIGVVGYFIFEVSMDKFAYNRWHPYISWIPILSFVVLRNSTPRLRNTVSTFYTFIGKCSLETFICQFHIWLASDTKGILVVSPWTEGPGSWTFNLALSTLLFITISHVLSGATGELSDWLITGREPKARAVPPLAAPSHPMPVVTGANSKEHEAGPVLPVSVKRQSVPMSPIAVSAGAARPSTLGDLMDMSLSKERAGQLNNEPNTTLYQVDGTMEGHAPNRIGDRAVGSSKSSKKQEETLVRIDTAGASRHRSDDAGTSVASPTITTFKSLWVQPVWKVTIFVAVIWLMNLGST
ncbi:hypothetical protein BGZ99_006695 [Dissophora globulifera]|uniref:Cas1p 10 TM acyl transferase domain-containing protein n=1 Tax=Dissophora globulifera TaxID=979702 RepID=A0A9P6RGE9_9FUNG|nr:hypothetical protein BGZ99_006695 [Dissophora globulifera]